MSDYTERQTRHAVFINRYGSQLANDFNSYIDDIKAFVTLNLAENPTDISQRKLRKLLKEIENYYFEKNEAYLNYLFEQLDMFGYDEVEFQAKNLSVDIDVDFELPSESQVYAAIRETELIFSDQNYLEPLSVFTKQWSENQIKRVSNVVRVGFTTGQTTEEITRDAMRMLNTTNKQKTKAMVRTAVAHTAQAATQELYKENDDIIIGYKWVSTLDIKTTTQCKDLDGEIFLNSDSGYKPKPPIHPQCRSTTTPYLDPKYGQDILGTKRAERGPSGKTSMTSSKQTYYEWLKKQPASFQKEALGATRYKLFRDGGLTSKEFSKLTTDELFRPLTLEEMRRKNPMVFEKANID